VICLLFFGHALPEVIFSLLLLFIIRMTVIIICDQLKVNFELLDVLLMIILFLSGYFNLTIFIFWRLLREAATVGNNTGRQMC